LELCACPTARRRLTAYPYASWFSRRIVEKLAELKADQPAMGEITELTLREQQVLARMANGMTNEQIGEALSIKDQTVRNYISVIYKKINVHSRAQAVVWARERGLHHFEADI
jgi:DNA-binding NarL/FixJ family response regulator